MKARQKTLTREQAIESALALREKGKLADAKMVLFAILKHYSGDNRSRGLLRDIVQTEGNSNCSLLGERLESVLRGDAKTHLENALKGWLYTLTIDSDFIDAGLAKISSKKANVVRDTSFDIDALRDRSASELLSELRQIRDIQKMWEQAVALTKSSERAIVEDSFAALSDGKLEKALITNQKSASLNIVVIGAGPIGLSIANSLKHSLGEKASILVIDNRIEELHYKKPYERHWLTNLPTVFFQGVIDPAVTAIMDSLGEAKYAGTSIALYETLLLLSCKNLGVSFLFSDQCDLSFIERSNTHVIFDATGGRLKLSGESYAQGAYRKKNESIGLQLFCQEGYSKDHARHAITKHTPAKTFSITGRINGGRLEPEAAGCGKLASAMFKVTHVPIELYDSLIEFVRPINSDGMIYVWPGRLKKEINEILLLINLDREGYAELNSVVDQPVGLSVFLQELGKTQRKLDERIVALFRFIEEQTDAIDRVLVEPPFLYEPYVKILTDMGDKYSGKPIIPVGDSIFVGHPKVGNGLGSHLPYVMRIHDAVLALYGRA